MLYEVITDKEFILPVVGKIVDPAVFEEATDNGNRPDGFGKAGHSGTEATAVTNDQVDLDACGGSLIQGFADVLV